MAREDFALSLAVERHDEATRRGEVDARRAVVDERLEALIEARRASVLPQPVGLLLEAIDDLIDAEGRE